MALPSESHCEQMSQGSRHSEQFLVQSRHLGYCYRHRIHPEVGSAFKDLRQTQRAQT